MVCVPWQTIKSAMHFSLRLDRPTMTHTSYHSVSNTLQSPFYTLENALRRTVLTSSRGLIVLHICGSSPVFVAHRKNESSTIHLCAVCLFLWFVKKLRSYWVHHQRSWGYTFQLCLDLWGLKYFIGCPYISEKLVPGVHISQLEGEGGGFQGSSIWSIPLLSLPLLSFSKEQLENIETRKLKWEQEWKANKNNQKKWWIWALYNSRGNTLTKSLRWAWTSTTLGIFFNL